MTPLSDGDSSIHPSDSAEQQHAERLLLDALSKTLGVCLTQEWIPVGDGGRICVDGACASPRIIVEAYAHYGRLRGAQPNKILADAAKLSLVPNATRRILLFADPSVAAQLATGWRAHALKAWGVEIMVEQLAPDEEAKIRSAQRRQFR